MNVTPLDLRQHKFRSSVRGFERSEVTAFLAEAADDYEQALHELDKMRYSAGTSSSPSTASVRRISATPC